MRNFSLSMSIEYDSGYRMYTKWWLTAKRRIVLKLYCYAIHAYLKFHFSPTKHLQSDINALNVTNSVSEGSELLFTFFTTNILWNSSIFLALDMLKRNFRCLWALILLVPVDNVL